jgi:signal transduction histidine kinase
VGADPDRPRGGATTEDPAALLARIDALERERRRAFDEAQREADALFAQYQLSQLVASGGSLDTLAAAVLPELVRLAGAAGGALWLGSGEGGRLQPVLDTGRPTELVIPTGIDSVEAARAWASTMQGARTLVLADDPSATVLVVWPHPGMDLDEDGLRITQLARHELAVAFSGARLRAALEQERHELTAIVDGATDLIVQVDGDGLVVRLNPAGQRLLGVAADDATGRPCSEVLGCEVAGGHAVSDCPLAAVRRAGAPIAYQETAVRGAEGAPVRMAGSYAATPGRGTARATAILRDLSAVRALEELREGFVATVSHELRTPLALIRGYAETLLHLDLDPSQQRAYVERIDEASARLTTLVDEVLDVTHLQADPLILERAPTSFASLVARLRGDLAVAGSAERLRVDAPSDLPPLDVDVARVSRVLVNLVGNALKYAPEPTPVVLDASADGDWLSCTVDDEGVGIPETDRALVLEPFHRAWNVRESRIPGTGLGLFICRRLVEAHGGRLWIADRPDGRAGTRVAFTLPLARDPRRPAPSPGAVHA